MIGYVTIGASEVEAALPFYDAVLGAIDYERKSFDGGWAFYGPKDGEGNVGICKPFDGQPARGGNGIMIAFIAPSQDAVRAAHAAGLKSGGTDEGARLPAAGRNQLLRRVSARRDRQQALRLPPRLKPGRHRGELGASVAVGSGLGELVDAPLEAVCEV